MRTLIGLFLQYFSKIVELEEELRVVGNNLKSLEVSEEKVWENLCIYYSKMNSHIVNKLKL